MEGQAPGQTLSALSRLSSPRVETGRRSSGSEGRGHQALDMRDRLRQTPRLVDATLRGLRLAERRCFCLPRSRRTTAARLRSIATSARQCKSRRRCMRQGLSKPTLPAAWPVGLQRAPCGRTLCRPDVSMMWLRQATISRNDRAPSLPSTAWILDRHLATSMPRVRRSRRSPCRRTASYSASGHWSLLHSNTDTLRGGARNSLAPAGIMSTSSASSVESTSFQCTGSSVAGRVKLTPSW